MEYTLQEVVDTLKDDQKRGAKLAKGERRLKDTASPSSARLLEAKALKKYKHIFNLSSDDRREMITRAAADFVRKTGHTLTEYREFDDLPEDAQQNIDRHVIEEYREALTRAGELSREDIQMLHTDDANVREAILQLEGYKGYRRQFWCDIQTVPHAWIFFDDFKVHMKQYWEGKI